MGYLPIIDSTLALSWLMRPQILGRDLTSQVAYISEAEIWYEGTPSLRVWGWPLLRDRGGLKPLGTTIGKRLQSRMSLFGIRSWAFAGKENIVA